MHFPATSRCESLLLSYCVAFALVTELYLKWPFLCLFFLQFQQAKSINLPKLPSLSIGGPNWESQGFSWRNVGTCTAHYWRLQHHMQRQLLARCSFDLHCFVYISPALLLPLLLLPLLLLPITTLAVPPAPVAIVTAPIIGLQLPFAHLYVYVLSLHINSLPQCQLALLTHHYTGPTLVCQPCSYSICAYFAVHSVFLYSMWSFCVKCFM